MNFHYGFLVPVFVMLLAARVPGEAAPRFGQPTAIGQLFAGLLLGRFVRARRF